jgi:N,N'-diacetylbacillosaminyl-diphospho-undecaprenol alpha-1,3-N-acetylgalactosaminyltransferase
MLSEAFIGDIRELYSIFDLFVLPSRREGLPTVLLEASSMCVPSVTTRATGCVDVVQDFYNGVIVDLDDPSQLSDAIVTLINNAPLRKRLGVAARATAVEKFDSQRACRALIEEYNALVGDNGNNTRPSGASGALAV